MKRKWWFLPCSFSFLLICSLASAGSFCSYEPVTDQYMTYRLIHPDYENVDVERERITELCTIGSVSYVYVPDGVVLPAQHANVQKTLKKIVPDAALIALIKKESPHYRLIDERINSILPTMKPEEGRYFMLSFDSDKMDTEKSKYAISSDVKNVKTALTPNMKEASGYAAEVVQWGIEQKEKIGLSVPEGIEK